MKEFFKTIAYGIAGIGAFLGAIALISVLPFIQYIMGAIILFIVIYAVGSLVRLFKETDDIPSMHW